MFGVKLLANYLLTYDHFLFYPANVHDVVHIIYTLTINTFSRLKFGYAIEETVLVMQASLL